VNNLSYMNFTFITWNYIWVLKCTCYIVWLHSYTSNDVIKVSSATVSRNFKCHNSKTIWNLFMRFSLLYFARDCLQNIKSYLYHVSGSLMHSCFNPNIYAGASFATCLSTLSNLFGIFVTFNFTISHWSFRVINCLPLLQWQQNPLALLIISSYSWLVQESKVSLIVYMYSVVWMAPMHMLTDRTFVL
jgi:hypothetical protein